MRPTKIRSAIAVIGEANYDKFRQKSKNWPKNTPVEYEGYIFHWFKAGRCWLVTRTEDAGKIEVVD